MNLLPPYIEEKKQKRKVLMRMFGVQSAIALLMVAVLIFLHFYAENTSERLAVLMYESRDIDTNLRAVASEVNYARSLTAYMDEVLPVLSSGEQLMALIEITPADVTINGIDFRDGLFIVNLTTNNIHAPEVHRLAAAEIFFYVRLGQLRSEVAGYSYELQAGTDFPE